MTLYAIWRQNTATITIKKDGSVWSASGIKIDLSTSNSSDTATFTSTVSSGSTATFNNTVSGTTYYIYAGKSDAAKTTMVNTGLTVTGGTNRTQTVNYYTITRSQGTGTILTTKWNNENGPAFTNNPVVLGNNKVIIYAAASANAGYDTLTLKHGSTGMTTSGSTFTVNARETIASEATAIEATLTYNANGHGTAPSQVTMNYTNETKAASAITAAGYTFSKWCTSSDGGGTCYDAGQQIKAANTRPSEMTLYAQWEKNVSKIKSTDIEYTDLQSAIEKCTNAETIILLANITPNTIINISSTQNITLDLDGHSITNDTTSAITNYGTLTVKGGTITSSVVALDNNGTLTVAGGEIISTAESPSYTTAAIYNKGVLEMTDGTVKAADTYAVYGDGNIEVTGGTIISANSYAIYDSNNNNNTVTVSNSNTKIESTNGTSISGKAVYANGATVTINNGTITGKYNGIYAENNSNIQIKDGTIIGKSGDGIRGIKENSYIEVTGGTIISEKNSGISSNGNITVIGSSSTGITGIYCTGTLTIGNNSNDVNPNNPVINEKTDDKYGVSLDGERAKLYFYDGKITGRKNNSSILKAINGVNDSDITIPIGYEISRQTDNEIEIAILRKTSLAGFKIKFSNSLSSTGCGNTSPQITVDNSTMQAYGNYRSTLPNSGTFRQKFRAIITAVDDNGNDVNIENGTTIKLNNLVYYWDGNSIYEQNAVQGAYNIDASLYVNCTKKSKNDKISFRDSAGYHFGYSTYNDNIEFYNNRIIIDNIIIASSSWNNQHVTMGGGFGIPSTIEYKGRTYNYIYDSVKDPICWKNATGYCDYD